MATPIWKDTLVTIGSGTYADYTIYADSEESGQVIYTGRAYPKPGSSWIEIIPNSIIADFLEHSSPDWYGKTMQMQNYERTFVINGAGYSSSLTFRNDWSYEEGYDPQTMGLSFPIDGKVDPRQLLLYTEYGDSENLDILVQYGGPRPDFQPWIGPGEGSFNADFLISAKEATEQVWGYESEGYRVFAIQLSNYDWMEGARRLTIGTRVWDVVECAEYALHYVNAYGGWDSLLVTGNGKATDTIKHYETGVAGTTRTTDPDNNRTRRNYVNDLTRKFTLHTGTLTEAQSRRMHHLLESPVVFLQDLSEGTRIRPVVITGNTCEFKTYRNNGNKLMEYTIEAELAETRMRR